MTGAPSVPLVLAWGAYLVLGPVYWLPGVDVGPVFYAKLAAAASATLLTGLAALQAGRFALPGGWAGPAGLIVLLVVSIGGFVQADTRDALQALLDYGYVFAVLWSFFMLARIGGDPYWLLVPVGLTMSLLCVPVVTQGLLGTPGWRAPAALDRFPLDFAGFGAGRTSWSNAMALYLPLALALVATPAFRPFRWLLFAGAGAALVGAQLVVGGRAGLLASLVVLVLWTVRRLPLPLSAALGGIVLVAVVSASSLLPQVAEYLRFTELLRGGDTFEALDDVSAGRLSGYAHALAVFAENPVLGQGFAQVFHDGHRVHNVWLRLLAEGGVLLPLAFGALVFTVYGRALRLVRAHDLAMRVGAGPRGPDPYPLFLGLTAGLVVMLFEPNMLLGSFQNSVVWWAVAGVVLGWRLDVVVRPAPAAGTPAPAPGLRPNLLDA